MIALIYKEDETAFFPAQMRWSSAHFQPRTQKTPGMSTGVLHLKVLLSLSIRMWPPSTSKVEGFTPLDSLKTNGARHPTKRTANGQGRQEKQVFSCQGNLGPVLQESLTTTHGHLTAGCVVGQSQRHTTIMSHKADKSATSTDVKHFQTESALLGY